MVSEDPLDKRDEAAVRIGGQLVWLRPPEGPEAAREHGLLMELGRTPDRIVGEVRANPNLSETGMEREISERLAMEFFGPVATWRERLQPRRAALEARGAGLDAFDKLSESDAAGALKRAEARALVRSMPAEERAGFVLSSSPEIKASVLDGDPVLSGIGADLHGTLGKRERERRHGSAMAELAPEVAALDSLATAIDKIESAGRALIEGSIDGNET